MTDFYKPTAKDMVDYFSSLPPETPFRVRDPDTDWNIYDFMIEVEPDGVARLFAEYHKMGDEDEIVQSGKNAK